MEAWLVELKHWGKLKPSIPLYCLNNSLQHMWRRYMEWFGIIWRKRFLPCLVCVFRYSWFLSTENNSHLFRTFCALWDDQYVYLILSKWWLNVILHTNANTTGPKDIKGKLNERIFTFKHQYCCPTSFNCSLARDCEEPRKFLEHTESEQCQSKVSLPSFIRINLLNSFKGTIHIIFLRDYKKLN